MLVLSRRQNESIFIGKDIVVTVLSNRGGQVRIGIDAPKEITILREEIRDRDLMESQHKEAP